MNTHVPLLPMLFFTCSLGCTTESKESDDTGSTTADDTASTDDGYTTYTHFPLDGDRSWTYLNEDVDYLLQVGFSSAAPASSGQSVKTFTYQNDSTGEALYSIDWSSNEDDGIHIHGHATVDASPTRYAAPIQVATARMQDGTTITSTVDGATVTSTLQGMEPCPNMWTQDWSCLVFTIEGDSSLPFVGTWALAADYGASSFGLDGSDGWMLLSTNWVPE